jgi:hypothetical protein
LRSARDSFPPLRALTISSLRPYFFLLFDTSLIASRLAAPFIDIYKQPDKNRRECMHVCLYGNAQAAVAINNTLFIITRLPNSTRVRFWLRALFTGKKSPQKTQANNKARAIENPSPARC